MSNLGSHKQKMPNGLLCLIPHDLASKSRVAKCWKRSRAMLEAIRTGRYLKIYTIQRLFRIFELNGMSDMKAFGTLISAFTTNFTASLDTYSAALKSVATTLGEDCDITGLINNQVTSLLRN